MSQSHADDEVAESLRLLMRFIADQSLEIQTIRVLLRAHGVTDAEYEHVRSELRRRWDSQADALVGKITEKRTAERLRRLLESAEGPEQ